MRVVTLLLLFLPCFAQAQDLIASDKVLSSIQKELGSNWDMAIVEDRITITYADSVWIHFFNSANAAHNDPGWSRDEAYVKKYGRKIKPVISYTMLTWNDSIQTAARAHNEDLQRQMRALVKKHDIEDVVAEGRHIGRYRNDPMRDLTKEELKRVQQYEKERESLKHEMIKFPRYRTEHYALLAPSMNYSSKNTERAYMLEQLAPAKATADIEKMEAILKAHIPTRK